MLLEIICDKIAKIAEAYIAQKCCPKQYKNAITVVLKKPHKDYSEAQSYRPIALLNTIGKVVESVVATRIRQILEATGGLPATQMGARQGRSTDSALELITEQVYTVWNGPAKRGEKPVASMLCLDIAGAFDRVAHPRLLHCLKKKGIPEKLVGFVESFLTERRTTIRFGAFESESFGIEVGIP